MGLMDMLASAQGGAFFANAAKAASVDETVARQAVEALSPAIAAELKSRAAEDEALFGDLLGLLEEGVPLDRQEALTGKEGISDGNAILKDIYGSKAAALKDLKPLAPDLPAKPFATLAAISATAVLAALAQANRPMALAGAQTAMGGEGLFGTLVTALVKGVVTEATRQIRQRTGVNWSTRRRSTARRRSTTKRKTTSKSRKKSTPPSSSISLEVIFRGIFK